MNLYQGLFVAHALIFILGYGSSPPWSGFTERVIYGIIPIVVSWAGVGLFYLVFLFWAWLGTL